MASTRYWRCSDYSCASTVLRAMSIIALSGDRDIIPPCTSTGQHQPAPLTKGRRMGTIMIAKTPQTRQGSRRRDVCSSRVGPWGCIESRDPVGKVETMTFPLAEVVVADDDGFNTY